MMPGGIVPLADFVMCFYEKNTPFISSDDQINNFLREHPSFYINLISPLSPTGVIVVFEGPADEVKKLRGEEQ